MRCSSTALPTYDTGALVEISPEYGGAGRQQLLFGEVGCDQLVLTFNVPSATSTVTAADEIGNPGTNADGSEGNGVLLTVTAEDDEDDEDEDDDTVGHIGSTSA